MQFIKQIFYKKTHCYNYGIKHILVICSHPKNYFEKSTRRYNDRFSTCDHSTTTDCTRSTTNVT